MKEIFRGDLVRLCAMDSDETGKAFSRWDRDSEFRRFLDSGVAHFVSSKKLKKKIEEEIAEQPLRQYPFGVRTLKDDALIGVGDLYVYNWTGRDAFVGLGFGEREFWGKGYGTDLMSLLLRYAFAEINLNRVTLNVFEYNPRAVRSYEKAGFRHEGRMRQFLNKEGKRWDMLFMGILRKEWMAHNEHRIKN